MSYVILTRQSRSLRLEMGALKDPDISSLLSGPHMSSAYEVLMHSLKHIAPRESRWWSRGRALTDELISPAMWGVMKVAGKRLSTLDQTRISHPEGECQRRALPHIPSATIHEVNSRDIIAWARALGRVSRPPLIGTRYASVIEAARALESWVGGENARLEEVGAGERSVEGRRWGGARRVVGALALNRAGEVIGAALNQPEISFTAHAEWCLLDDLWRRGAWPLDGEVTLIASLKPCKLCAGAWVTHAPYTSLTAYVLRDDPGPNGQHTAFDLDSYAHEEARRWRSDWGSLSQVRLSLDGRSERSRPSGDAPSSRKSSAQT